MFFRLFPPRTAVMADALVFTWPAMPEGPCKEKGKNVHAEGKRDKAI